MRVIDLLNKIANGEELPEKIKFKIDKYILKNEDEVGSHKYINTEKDKNGDTRYLFQDWIIDAILNDEIEIIGEVNEIEKLYSTETGMTTRAPGNFELMDKINELVDAVNEIRRG